MVVKDEVTGRISIVFDNYIATNISFQAQNELLLVFVCQSVILVKIGPGEVRAPAEATDVTTCSPLVCLLFSQNGLS